MKALWAILAGALVVSCGGSPDEKQASPTDTDTSTDTQTESDDEDDEEEVVQKKPKKKAAGLKPFKFANKASSAVSGSGDDIVDFELKSGLALFELSHAGDSNFIVHLVGDDDEAYVANEIGAYSGIVAVEVEETGTHTLEVRADGDWTAQVLVTDIAKSFPKAIEGASAGVSSVFPMKRNERRKVAVSHRGSDNFIVHLADARSGEDIDLLANEIGDYDGNVLVKAEDASYYVITVEADGEWSITLK